MNEVSIRSTQVIAAEINGIKEHAKKIFLISSVEIGSRLVEAKAMVSHGEWGKWLQESVDYSQSTANNLMKLYKEFGSEKLSLFGENQNSQALGNLSYTQAVALLGIPGEQRIDFIENNDIENMSTRELQEAIKKQKVLEQQLAASEKKRQLEIEKNDSLLKKQQILEEEQKHSSETIKKLETQIKVAEEEGDDSQVQKLNEQLESTIQEIRTSKEKITLLENQLKAKPIEVAAIEEKIPLEIERELLNLREQVSKTSKSEVELKFQYSFDTLVGNFQALLTTLGDMEDEQSVKYKGAIVGLLEKMNKTLN